VINFRALLIGVLRGVVDMWEKRLDLRVALAT
jgi:hypothetical protein